LIIMRKKINPHKHTKTFFFFYDEGHHVT